MRVCWAHTRIGGDALEIEFCGSQTRASPSPLSPEGRGESSLFVQRYFVALLLATTACSPPQPIPPGKIVSNNPCVDAILADIVAPGADRGGQRLVARCGERIGTSRLGRAGFPALGTGAEDVIAARPRLALVGTQASPGLKHRAAGESRASRRHLAFGVPGSVD